MIELIKVNKRFGAVQALADADLRVEPGGTVLGLVGENGSGKSTMLGILAGYIPPDRGRIEVNGRAVRFRGPVDALREGIVMVSQETAVAPHLSVAENVLLGRRLVRRRAGISWRRTHAHAREVLAQLDLTYDTSALVAELRPDQRQMVEIARALSMEAKVLILDEPTSSLTDDEVASLMAAVRRLRTRGVATIFVSHRIREVFALSDYLTVLRDGRTVSAGPVSEYDDDSLVAALVGDADFGDQTRARRPSGGRALPAEKSVGLRLENLTAADIPRPINFEVRRGEIVGLAGLVGAGRSELLEILFGVRPVQAGRLFVDGQPYTPKTPRAAIAAGVGYLPPERRSQGLVLSMSVAANVSMVAQCGRRRWRAPDRKREARLVGELAVSMRLKAPAASAPAAALSGGNQQKVALAKWLIADPAVLLLDEPTRGVDIAAKAEIHQLLRNAAADGMALLVSSSEYDELVELCDRVVVMFRGGIAANLLATDATEGLVARYAGGAAR